MITITPDEVYKELQNMKKVPLIGTSFRTTDATVILGILKAVNISCEKISLPAGYNNAHNYTLVDLHNVDISKITKNQVTNEMRSWGSNFGAIECVEHIIMKERDRK